MRDFIFDQYGYYYEGDESEFVYQGFDFKLVANSYSEPELNELEQFIVDFNNRLSYSPKTHLVKNRVGNYGVETELGSVALVCVKQAKYNINDLLEFQQIGSNYHSRSPYTISNLIELWEEKLSLVEEKCVPYLKIDDFTYPMILKETIFAIGLCSNAIEYLTDLKNDYQDEVKRLTFSHRRLYDLSSFDMFNPYNIVMDSPVRDYAFLYKEGSLSIQDIISLIDYNNFTQDEISLLFARVLFPTATFDILEDNYSLKKDIKLPIVKKTKETKRDLGRVVALHKALVERYRIRPIDWIMTYPN